MNTSIFQTIQLDEQHHIYTSEVIPEFNITEQQFSMMWDEHPQEYHPITIHGKKTLTPRWSQAYGKNYKYTGSVSNALPIPDILLPFLTWSQEHISPQLNGLLLNWYDGSKGHYIGKHRDKKGDLIKGSDIVTISLGEERIFRMRPFKDRNKPFKDFLFQQGQVIVIPWDTNIAWYHEVPKFAKYKGKRISITIKAFL